MLTADLRSEPGFESVGKNRVATHEKHGITLPCGEKVCCNDQLKAQRAGGSEGVVGKLAAKASGFASAFNHCKRFVPVKSSVGISTTVLFDGSKEWAFFLTRHFQIIF